jgi:mannose-6-phosphate isomerase-like protein (cupin superfamily)
MIVKHVADHLIKHSPWCGEIREILERADYAPLSVAIAVDIQPTRAHFHRTFDEIYFVLDGSIELHLSDPGSGKTWTETLAANELFVISKGLHHGITHTSPHNRLCVICTPPFDPQDETTSERI